MPSRPIALLEHSVVHGRGVCATTDIGAGEMLEEAPTIDLTPLLYKLLKDTPKSQEVKVANYSFARDENGQEAGSLAFGLCSLCNHSEEANAELILDRDRNVARLLAKKPISSGEEIFLTYKNTPFRKK